MNWINIRSLIFDSILILAGILSAGFGLRGFLLPNTFIDGGVVGISLLIAELTPITLPVLLVIVNIPFIIMGVQSIGRGFALKTALAIAGLSLAVAFIPYPEITHDKLLVSVFGGFFLGAGIGLSVRGGSVIDGTEVLAIFLSKKTGMTIGDIILIINIMIFSVAAYMLSVEIALYSILTYLSASRTVDFFVEGIEEYISVTIVSNFADEIREMIVNKLGHGVTIFKGEKGFNRSDVLSNDISIVFTVITRLEMIRLNTEIKKIDKNAFIIMNSIKDTKGGMIKKRPLH